MGSETLTLGHTGRLLDNAFVFYDKKSGSEFCQANGVCSVGAMAGRELARVPAWNAPWGAWRALYPRTRVMIPPAASTKDYTHDVYEDYNRSARAGLHPLRHLDERLPAKVMVMGVELAHDARVWTLRRLAHDRVRNETVGGTPVVVAWDAGGSWATCLERTLDGRVLTFTAADQGELMDDRGGRWDMVGRCTAGPSRGARLKPVPALVAYWFALQAHYRVSALLE